MPRDARFWRNVALIAIAHLAVLLALARGSRDTQNASLPSIIWMNSTVIESAASTPAPAAPEVAAPAPQPEKHEQPAVPALAKSEIQLPSPTPIATPKPKATITPTPIPKPSPKDEKKDKADGEKKDAPTKKNPAVFSKQPADNLSAAGDGPGNGSSQASEFAWYRTMLHDRFRKDWEQPKTVVATGAKMSTLVKIRIEKDGRVSKFTIVKPSGNVVVDESVGAIAQRVTQVDALPTGLIKGAYYEVQINFELNPEK